MNSALHSKPVHPIEEYESDLATFDDAIKRAEPREKPGMFEDWMDAASVLVPLSVGMGALLAAIVWSVL